MSAIAPWWGQLCIGGFIGWLIVLAWAIARAAKRGDEQPARGEAEAQLPDFYSHLEPLSIGVELDKQAGRDRQVRGAGSVGLGEPTDINTARGRAVADYETGPPACRPIRVHRRERATLPARRGDR